LVLRALALLKFFGVVPFSGTIASDLRSQPFSLAPSATVTLGDFGLITFTGVIGGLLNRLRRILRGDPVVELVLSHSHKRTG
jgi:hypothetical protein